MSVEAMFAFYGLMRLKRFEFVILHWLRYSADQAKLFHGFLNCSEHKFLAINILISGLVANGEVNGDDPEGLMRKLRAL